MRVLAEPLVGFWDSYKVEHLPGPCVRSFLVEALVDAQSFSDLFAYGEDRIQAC